MHKFNSLKSISLALAFVSSASSFAIQPCVPNGEVIIGKGEIKDAFGDNRFENDTLDLSRVLALYSPECHSTTLRYVKIEARLHSDEDSGSVEFISNGVRLADKEIKRHDEYKGYDLVNGANIQLGRAQPQLRLRLNDKVALNQIKFRFGPAIPQIVNLGNSLRGAPEGTDSQIYVAGIGRSPLRRLRLVGRDSPVLAEFVVVTLASGQTITLSQLPLNIGQIHDINLGGGAWVQSIRIFLRSNFQGYIQVQGVL